MKGLTQHIVTLICLLGFFEAGAQNVLLQARNAPSVNMMTAEIAPVVLPVDLSVVTVSEQAAGQSSDVPLTSLVGSILSVPLNRVEIDLPPVPLGFFCKFENNLGKKSPIPVNFGTD